MARMNSNEALYNGFLEFAQGVATLKAASEGKYPPPQPVYAAPAWVLPVVVGIIGVVTLAIVYKNPTPSPAPVSRR